jgi:hypothetical protein
MEQTIAEREIERIDEIDNKHGHADAATATIVIPLIN